MRRARQIYWLYLIICMVKMIFGYLRYILYIINIHIKNILQICANPGRHAWACHLAVFSPRPLLAPHPAHAAVDAIFFCGCEDAVYAGSRRPVHERQAGTSCAGTGCRHILWRAVMGASTRCYPHHHVSGATLHPASHVVCTGPPA